MPEDWRCRRCHSDRKISVSYTRGDTLCWQCVPCGWVDPKPYKTGQLKPSDPAYWD